MTPRKSLLISLMAGVVFAAHAAPALAQMGHGGSGDQAEKDEAKRKKREEEFGKLVNPLPELRNAGPCPFVRTLYDAARYLEFKNNVEASADAEYTGEIQNITSTCAYKGAEPIKVAAQVLFEFGRGPQAGSRTKIYHYWVAVTDRNHGVLDKQEFSLPVTFPNGKDRVTQAETFSGIVIPRHDAKVSGANFEILIGFDVTPEMADFNRQGKRFRANATGQAANVAAAGP